jgi:serine/threonine protein kinase
MKFKNYHDLEQMIKSLAEKEDPSLLKKLGLYAKNALKYRRTINIHELSDLISYNISPQEARGYNLRFSGFELAVLINAGISPETANRYSRRISGAAIPVLELFGVSEKEASKYDCRFSAVSLGKLLYSRVPSEIANSYPKRFLGFEIVNLVNKGITAEQCSRYNNRFRASELELLIKNNIDSSVADAFNSRFNGREISHMLEYKITPELAGQYSPRWNAYDIIFLSVNRVSAEIAERYDRRFSARDIAALSVNKISPEDAVMYDSRFSGEDIGRLSYNKISPETAGKYSAIFRGEDIIKFFKFSIAPDEALKCRFLNKFSQYDSRFTSHEIKELFRLNITPETANSFHECFGYLGMHEFRKAGIKPEQANAYAPGFKSSYSIIEMIKNEITPLEAALYDERFDGYDVCCLIGHGLTPEESKLINKHVHGAVLRHYLGRMDNGVSLDSLEAIIGKLFEKDGITKEQEDAYDSRFSAGAVIEYVKKGVSAPFVNSYSKRFSSQDIDILIEDNVKPDIANTYPEWIEADYISELHKAGITADIVLKYPRRFDARGIKLLIEKKISLDAAIGYSRHLSASDISELIEAKVAPEDACLYNEDYNGFEIALISKSNVPIDRISKYDKRFSVVDILNLIKANVSPSLANQYADFRPDSNNSRFFGREIAALISHGIDSQTALSYKDAAKHNKEFSAIDIIILQRLGLSPFHILNSQNKNLLNLLEGIVVHEAENKLNSRAIGTGASGVILQTGNTAWKFSKDILREYTILKKIRKNNPQNILNVIAKPKEGVCMQIEYIAGESLETLIKETKRFKPEQIYKISRDIMKGLVEMRRSGVYFHRDLRPANIMIDKESGRAVIIDFGIASVDRHAKPKDNRRYGSSSKTYANDLISLGQIMYKMATGSHIFAKSRSMETSMHADYIKDEREMAYSGKSGGLLPSYIQKIETNVTNDALRHLIISCLESKNHFYNKMHREFEHFSSSFL